MLTAHHSSSWFGNEHTYGIKSSTSLGEHTQGDYFDISWSNTYWLVQNDRAYSHPYYLNHRAWNRNQNVPEVVSKTRPYL